MKYLFKYLTVTILFLISSLLFITSGANNWPYKLYVISSDSMSPNLKRGDVVISEESSKNLIVGDVITFRSPTENGVYITHRIVRENFDQELFYTTKGDNNSTEDPWQITPDMVVGRLKFSVPLVGYPILLIKSSIVYIFLIGAVLLIINFIEINFLSKEIAYEWERKNSYALYRRFKRLIARADIFLARMQVNKIKNVPAE